MKKVGIYVHFPFCASKCSYCDFNSYSGKNDWQVKYLQALIKEIEGYASRKFEVDTIFIGGGTPSIMFDGCITALISELKKHFVVQKNAEITIEANPNSVTLAKAREWKECGINRVSIGLQTINNSSLKLLNRPHTREDYVKAVEVIKSVGISNINTDCLVGLPRQKQSHVRKTLQLITKLECTHVSVYSLILEEKTPLCDMVKSGEVTLPKEEKTLDMYNFACSFLQSKNLERYEVSNFSLKNFECKHNLHTWNMGEYLGFGAGAHSFFDDVRYSNELTIDGYISQISNGNSPIIASEKLTNEQKFEETIMLGLRTKQGINLVDIESQFEINLLKSKKDVIEQLKNYELIIIKNNFLAATNLGFAVLNTIIIDLIST